jgi:hypothetical protein
MTSIEQETAGPLRYGMAFNNDFAYIVYCRWIYKLKADYGMSAE